ncbi:MAG: DUF4097 family beta strand repeat-containing protein [Defluviitaleaceae bacterium]|nr:DUF4097 family beta strand repeat-containing protein [Defluviitaleaceae bacterium]
MTKQSFMSELKRELAHAPSHIREEIMADISEHFSEAISQGMTEEEVCRNLGQPGTIAAQVHKEYGEQAARRSQTSNTSGNQYNNGHKQGQGTDHEYDDDDDDGPGSFGGFFANFGRMFGGGGSRAEGHVISIDQSFDGICDINIKLSESTIRFAPSDDNRVRITIRGQSRHNIYTVENRGGTLYVRDQKPHGRFMMFNFSTKLDTTVYLPAQFTGEIKARSAMGKISAHDVSGQLDLKAAAGNISVENHRGKRIRIRAAAGNATVHMQSGRVDEIDISTAAGNAKITAEETGRLRVESAAGNVDATINRLYGDTKISTAAGSAYLEAHDVAGNIDISTAAGSAKALLPADLNCRIEAAKPAIGSLSNELRGNPNAPYVLRASSGVGSIKLKAL